MSLKVRNGTDDTIALLDATDPILDVLRGLPDDEVAPLVVGDRGTRRPSGETTSRQAAG